LGEIVVKIVVDDQEVLSENFKTYENMLDAYRDDEAKNGRTVPAHALEALLIGVALWLLEKAAEKSIDWVLERPKRVQERQAEAEAARRHEELVAELRSLKQLTAEARRMAHATGDIARAADKPVRAPKTRIRVRVELETGAEGDLDEAFRIISRELPVVDIIVSRPL
jgi:hypothetical protein